MRREPSLNRRTLVPAERGEAIGNAAVTDTTARARVPVGGDNWSLHGLAGDGAQAVGNLVGTRGELALVGAVGNTVLGSRREMRSLFQVYSQTRTLSVSE